MGRVAIARSKWRTEVLVAAALGNGVDAADEAVA